jgi:hypothetical protein
MRPSYAEFRFRFLLVPHIARASERACFDDNLRGFRDRELNSLECFDGRIQRVLQAYAKNKKGVSDI